MDTIVYRDHLSPEKEKAGRRKNSTTGICK